jgi:hypothetical protein
MKKKFADKLLLLLLLLVGTPLHTRFNVIQSIYCPINWFANCLHPFSIVESDLIPVVALQSSTSTAHTCVIFLQQSIGISGHLMSQACTTLLVTSFPW